MIRNSDFRLRLRRRIGTTGIKSRFPGMYVINATVFNLFKTSNREEQGSDVA